MNVDIDQGELCFVTIWLLTKVKKGYLETIVNFCPDSGYTYPLVEAHPDNLDRNPVPNNYFDGPIFVVDRINLIEHRMLSQK